MLITASIAWIITGSWRFAAVIGGIDTLIKIAAYYFHERFWNRVSFGRSKEPDYQI